MANQQHIAWLREGVAAWNARRAREFVVPDFEGADFADIFAVRDVFNVSDKFNIASFSGANFCDTNFKHSNLSNADLSYTVLRGADLVGAEVTRAIFEGADVTSTLVVSGPKKLLVTDLRGAIGLTQDQINSMNGDYGTLLPNNLSRPVSWNKDPQHGISQVGVMDPGDRIESIFDLAREGKLKIRASKGVNLAGLEDLMRESEDGLSIEVDRTNKDYETNNIQKARTKLASVTPIADVEWTETGHLKAELKPIRPQPRQPVPTPNPAAVTEQLRGVLALSKQLRHQIENSTSPNAAPFIGDAGKIFIALEAELAKDQSDLIPVVVKANVAALKAMGPSAEALAATEEAVYAVFIDEADKLLDLLPVLKIIENPYNEEIIPDEAVEPALDILHQLDEDLNSPEVIAEFGPSLGGVTRDADGFPWESDKQKIANKSSFWLQVYDKLKNPPDYVNNAANYITITTGPLALIIALFTLLFS